MESAFPTTDLDLGIVGHRKIPHAVRQAIFDGLAHENVSWCGVLEDHEFLSRIWDLGNMRSTDNRFKDAASDIWQHRVNNHDWDDDWVYSDARFDLHGCDNETFLKFLAMTVHPSVRRDADQAEQLVSFYNQILEPHGFELARSESQPTISGKPLIIYAGRPRHAPPPMQTETFERLSDPTVLHEHLRRIDGNVAVDPSAAIGSCKELVESVCKVVLDDYDEPYSPKDDMNALYRKVADVLRLKAESVPNNKRGSEAAQLALRGLVTTVQALAELRNEIGNGHGRSVRSAALSRHARLAASAARAITEFLLETWHARKASEAARQG